MAQRSRVYVLAAFVLAFVWMSSTNAHGAEFYSRINLQPFAVDQELEQSPANSGNSLAIPEQVARFDLRPDFELQAGRIELGVKPRVEAEWRRTADADGEIRTDRDTDLFVNEWIARMRLADPLFASYGRENLQWGPALLLSASNPFNRDNGRDNTAIEVPGMDYGRLIWIPSAAWTISAIANTDEGQRDIDRFERTYALKLDYTGRNKYLSLIPAYREDTEDYSAGLVAGISPSDAWLLYAEGTVAEAEARESVLAGASYTFAGGATFVAEYLYQPEGCDAEPYLSCFTSESSSLASGSPLRRRNYLFLQAYRSFRDDQADLTLRWTAGLDDDSSRLILLASHEIGQHMNGFIIANGFFGDDDTEFGSLLNYSVLLGLSYTF